MAVTRKVSLTDEINKWKKLKIKLLNEKKRATDIIQKHNAIIRLQGNPAKKIKNVQPSEVLIDQLFDIKNELLNSRQRIEEFRTQLGRDYDKAIEEIKDSYELVIKLIIQVSKITADKYMYLSEGTDVIHKKRKFVKYAHIHAQKAWNNLNENIHILPPNFDPDLKGFVDFVNDRYLGYFLQNNLDAIDEFLVAARNEKNKDEAFNKFEEALALAVQQNDILRQFFILWEQARSYAENLFESKHQIAVLKEGEINKYRSIIRRVCDSSIKAIKIKLAYHQHNERMLMNSEGIAIDLFQFANYSIMLSRASSIKFNFAVRKTLLNDAKQYQLCGDLLQKNIAKDLVKFAELACNIKDEINRLNIEREKFEKEQQENETRSIELKKLQQEYDEKFSEILAKFPTSQKIKTQSNAPNSTEIISTDQSEEDLSTLEIAEEEELIPTYITFTGNEVKSSRYNAINLAEHLELLANAETIPGIDGLLEQVRVRRNIADYYRIEAAHFLRRTIFWVKVAIQQLQLAKENLTIASDTINKIHHEAEKNNQIVEVPLEKWVINVLEDTETLLTKTINHQKDIEKRFDQTHDIVMADIIRKHGWEAWFKPEPFAWNKLKIESKIRLTAKDNLQELETLKYDVSKILFKLKTEEAINKEAAVNLILRSQEHRDNLPQIEFKKEDKVDKKALFKNNFFNNQNSVTPLQRSLSFNSYFEMNEILRREARQNDFGRVSEEIYKMVPGK